MMKESYTEVVFCDVEMNASPCVESRPEIANNEPMHRKTTRTKSEHCEGTRELLLIPNNNNNNNNNNKINNEINKMTMFECEKDLTVNNNYYTKTTCQQNEKFYLLTWSFSSQHK